MKKTVVKSNYRGVVNAPASKSYFQRALALALLAGGRSVLENITQSDDSRNCIKLLESLNVKLREKGNKLFLDSSNIIFKSNKLSCGESGLCIRMFSPILALFDEDIELSGMPGLRKRPAGFISEALQELNVESNTDNGFPPIKIKGPLKGGKLEMDSSLSSQLLSGLLIALPVAKNDSHLKIKNLTSIPYIDMSLDIINDFGVKIENKNYEDFYIKGGQKYNTKNYFVEGDWSGAAFHLVGGALAGDISVKNLNPNSKQADIAILEILKKAGANINIAKNKIKVKKSNLKGFNFDATDCPDLFPPIVVLAAGCKGTSVIKGVGRLKHKESDRASVLVNEFRNIGLDINISGDEMIIKHSLLKGGVINSHNDHRIAMAAAIAGLISQNNIIIEDAAAINKSYPGFYEDFEGLRVG